MSARLLILLEFTLLAAFIPEARGQEIDLAVQRGQCDFVLPASDPKQQYLLVVGSLANNACQLSIESHATSARAYLPHDSTSLYTPPPRTSKPRRSSMSARFPATLKPPAAKSFYLFTGVSDLDNPDQYLAVVADLHTVGKTCQVYVDRNDNHNIDPLIAEVVRSLDSEIIPWCNTNLGDAADVDRDGRFTIFVSSWLSKLQAGKTRVDGFVRGSDFVMNVDAPFSNHCDMMYLNAQLQPGPHLRTVLCHEYTHAITFTAHALGEITSGRLGLDEESWLSEGLSHLVELHFGYSGSNLDYRASAYLSAPERYPLVVPDAFASGLWRTPGVRGAVYLFLKNLEEAANVDHRAARDVELLRNLIQSNKHGISNLESAAQLPFPTLFRQSAVSLLTCQGAPAPGVGPGSTRLWCGPYLHDINLQVDRLSFDLARTGVTYLRLHSPSTTASAIHLVASEESDIQVSLIALPVDQARLEVIAQRTSAGLKLKITAHDRDVILEAAAWERLNPIGRDDADTSFRPGSQAASLGQWFPTVSIHAGKTIESYAIPLPESLRTEDIVIKVLAHTSAGPVVGWAIVSVEGQRK